MNNIFFNNIGSLTELQHASYYNFLYRGISEELRTFPNPIFAKIHFPTRLPKEKFPTFIYFATENIKYKGPGQNCEDCLTNGLTYAISFFVSAQFNYDYDKKYDINPNYSHILLKKKIKKIVLKQDILFGKIPLITDEGSFIINGYEKIIISQIIRSPGIYFEKNFTNTKKLIYSATIISDKGLWTHVFLEEKNNKDNIYLSLPEINKASSLDPNIDKETINTIQLLELLQFFGISYQELSDSVKYSLFLETFNISEDTLKKDKLDFISNLKERAFNETSGFFSIGELGRYKINKKLGLNLPKDIDYLTVYDFIGIIDGLIELKYYERLADDIDHLKHKRIRSVGDLLQNQIRIGFSKLKKDLLDSSSDKEEDDIEIDEELFSPNSTIKDKNARTSSELIINPRIVTNTMKEFFITSQLSQFMDQINPLAELTHKRRISVFGPNGLKRDHVSLAIRDIHPSQYAKLCPIETPEGQNAGLIASLAMYARVAPFGFLETPYFAIAKKGILSQKRAIYINTDQESSVAVGFSDYALTKNKIIDTELLSVKQDSLLFEKKIQDVHFYTTSPIQLISLATALIPFVEHDDANRALMGSNMQRQAVPLLYTQKAIVGTGFEALCALNSQTVIKNYNEGHIIYSSSSYIAVKDLSNQVIYYYLKKYQRSNQKTCLTQKIILWPKEKVYSGQIMVDGSSTNEGELSLGKNLTIAYMPWEGYNFEDAIVVSDRLLTDESLTSLHLDEYEVELTYSAEHSENLTKYLKLFEDLSTANLDNNGIVRIGSVVKEGDILVGKLAIVEDTDLTKIIKALYRSDRPSIKDESLRVPKKGEGTVVAVKILSDDKFERSRISIRIHISILQKRKLNIGDKLAGRHGNKGIISRILPVCDMPYLMDGTPIDIIFNPLGVPSRMNVGQIFECLLGLAGEHLEKRFKVIPFDEIYGKEASRILINQKLKEAALHKNSSWLYNPYSVGKFLLRDGRTGDFFDNPITVGKSYILKLIHLVEDKIHARATGPYTNITEQPVAGKANEGGQRFGEMEVWALEAYGASSILQELLTIKSDDIDGRNDMYEFILHKNEWDKRVYINPSIPESFLVLIRELNSLGLNFSFYKIQEFEENDNINIETDIFLSIEKRLKLRHLLKHEKNYNLAKVKNFTSLDGDLPKTFSTSNSNLEI